MRVAIVQSSFVPWRGYFDLIASSDLFVIFDEAQFSKGSWRNRNRIKTQQGLRWITVPVLHRKLEQSVRDTRIDENRSWRARLRGQLEQSYGRAPFFGSYAGELFHRLDSVRDSLSELNIALTHWICGELGIDTRIEMSSSYPGCGRRTSRLLEILTQAGAGCYLSGPSARSYLEPEQFRRHAIRLEYKRYEYAEYPQPWGPFVGEVSVLDVLFNVGPRAGELCRSRVPDEVAVP